MAKWDLPRPAMVCPRAVLGQHSMLRTYDRPWQLLWRRRYLLVCANEGCNEIRIDPKGGLRG